MPDAPRRDAIVGAVLVGGRSRRMGRDKAALPLPDGRTLLDAAIDALRPLVGRVVLLGDTPLRPELERVPDRVPDAGPLAGIDALLASLAPHEHHALIVPCDMPRLDAAALAHLLAAEGPAAAFRVQGEPDLRPLPARIDRAAADAVRAGLAGGRRAIRDLLHAVGGTTVPWPADAADRLAGCNTPEEFARLAGDPTLPRGA